MNPDSEQEQLEAKYQELGCTVLPPNLSLTHPAFAAVLAAVMSQKEPLTQEQIADIMEAHESED